MAKKAACEMCGERFDQRRDHRRWKATALPVLEVAHRQMAAEARAKPKTLVVCTECFLNLAESEYGA